MFILKNVKFKNILDIDYLYIEKGKVTSILGQSGSGKTSLIKLLNKMISKDSGEILYKNKNLEDYDPIDLRRSVLMLGQNPAIFQGNIKDNLEIGFKFQEKKPIGQKEMIEALEKVGLKKELEQETDKLSGGEKQRLALARIILLDPEVLILDEPSSALDEKTADLVIKNTVNWVKEKNKSLIMVSHSKKIAKKYSDKIIFIKDGKILKEGEINE